MDEEVAVALGREPVDIESAGRRHGLEEPQRERKRLPNQSQNPPPLRTRMRPTLEDGHKGEEDKRADLEDG